MVIKKMPSSLGVSCDAFSLGSQRPEREFEARLDQVLAASWNYYKSHYVQPDGRVSRPDNGNDTVSEGQAYALLRSVWSGDQATFERCYGWAEENYRKKGLKAAICWPGTGGRMIRAGGGWWMPTAPATPTWTMPWL